MVQYHVAFGRYDDAAPLVVRHHYSRRVPSNVEAVGTWHESGGLFGDRGEAVAACFFSIPPTRWAENVLELSRLVRAPHVQAPLSSLVGETVAMIRRAKRADLVVSFADWTEGHHGGIYQAAGWNYAGKRDAACDGVLLDGVFIPGRSCNSRWGTRSPDKLRSILTGRRIEPHFDAGKHLYWRALNRHGIAQAKRAGLGSIPYPKPANRPEDEAATSGIEAGATPAVRSTSEAAA